MCGETNPIMIMSIPLSSPLALSASFNTLLCGWLGCGVKSEKNMKTRRLAVLRALLEREKLSRGNP